MTVRWLNLRKNAFKGFEILICGLVSVIARPSLKSHAKKLALFVDGSASKHQADLFIESLNQTELSDWQLILFVSRDLKEQFSNSPCTNQLEICVAPDKGGAFYFAEHGFGVVGNTSPTVIFHPSWLVQLTSMIQERSLHRFFWIQSYSIAHYEYGHSKKPNLFAAYQTKSSGQYIILKEDEETPVQFRIVSSPQSNSFQKKIFSVLSRFNWITPKTCAPAKSFACDLAFRANESNDSRSYAMDNLTSDGWLADLETESPYQFYRYLQKKIDYRGQTFAALDVVIPVIPRDLPTLAWCLKGLRQNILNPINTVFIVGPDDERIRSFCIDKNCIFLDETQVVPIFRSKIKYTVNGLDRSGWIFQQFIKLNVDTIGHESSVLVIDSDTVLLRKQAYEMNSKFILRCSDEFHLPYYKAITKLMNTAFDFPKISLTSHQMIFDRTLLKNMKKHIEIQNPGKTWCEAILSVLDQSEPSSFSDYEVYGQWLQEHEKDKVLIQYWRNVSMARSGDGEIGAQIEKLKLNFDYDSASFHHHFKKSKQL